jgi:stearoyl-CoA desaturase (delta-9 desaturase)
VVRAVWPYVVMGAAAVVAGLVVTQVAMCATTVYLHRCLAHGGVALRPGLRGFSRVVIWITTALKPRQWARVHRYHHAMEDTAGDPHTPRNFGGGRSGAWQVLWRNASLYTASTRDARLADKYVDLRADRWDRWFFDHGEIGLAIGIGALCALLATVGHFLIGGWAGVSIGVCAGLLASGVHAACYVLGGGAINGFGHAAPDSQLGGGYALNLPALAWLTVGEGWHRNHHQAENSPRFAWGRQVDLGWVAICALRHLRLAQVTRRGEAGLARLHAISLPAQRQRPI